MSQVSGAQHSVATATVSSVVRATHRTHGVA